MQGLSRHLGDSEEEAEDRVGAPAAAVGGVLQGVRKGRHFEVRGRLELGECSLLYIIAHYGRCTHGIGAVLLSSLLCMCLTGREERFVLCCGGCMCKYLYLTRFMQDDEELEPGERADDEEVGGGRGGEEEDEVADAVELRTIQLTRTQLEAMYDKPYFEGV